MLGRKRCQNMSTISIHIPSLVKIQLFRLSSGKENMDVWRADNSVINLRNSPICNPKPDVYNINAHTKFGENPLIFTQVIVRKGKKNGRGGQITRSKINKIFPLAIPNQNSTISKHIPSWRKSIDIYTSYRPETKIWPFGR